MIKRTEGLMDLLPPELRQQLESQKVAEEIWNDAIDYLRDTLGNEFSQNALAIALVREGKEYPLDDLLDTYKREIEADFPHDPEVERLFVELLSRPARSSLFKKKVVGRPVDQKKPERDFHIARNVLQRINDGYKKGDAYKIVADEYGVSKSTAEKAYKANREAAEGSLYIRK